MPLNDKKLIFADVETTGLDPSRHEIIEIGALVVRQSDLSILDSWEAKVAPAHIEAADTESLGIAGWSAEAWQGAIEQQKAIQTFAEKARGCILVAYNVTFDWAFLETTARRQGVELGLDYHRLDALSMAYFVLHRHPDLPGLGLEKVARVLGVPLDRATRHSAMADTRAMYEIFKKLVSKPA